MDTTTDTRNAAQVIHEGTEIVADTRAVVDWLTAHWQPGMPVPEWQGSYACDRTRKLALIFYATNPGQYQATLAALFEADGTSPAAPASAFQTRNLRYLDAVDVVETTRDFGHVHVSLVSYRHDVNEAS